MVKLDCGALNRNLMLFASEWRGSFAWTRGEPCLCMPAPIAASQAPVHDPMDHPRRGKSAVNELVNGTAAALEAADGAIQSSSQTAQFVGIDDNATSICVGCVMLPMPLIFVSF